MDKYRLLNAPYCNRKADWLHPALYSLGLVQNHSAWYGDGRYVAVLPVHIIGRGYVFVPVNNYCRVPNNFYDSH